MLEGDEKNLLCDGIYQDVPVADSEASVMFPCTQLRAIHWYGGEIVALDPSLKPPTQDHRLQQGSRRENSPQRFWI